MCNYQNIYLYRVLKIKWCPGASQLAENKLNVSEEFLFWFSGLVRTDGEGNFSISLDRNYIRFRFKLNLHINDLQVLKVIKSKLNIGIIIIVPNYNYLLTYMLYLAFPIISIYILVTLTIYSYLNSTIYSVFLYTCAFSSI